MEEGERNKGKREKGKKGTVSEWKTRRGEFRRKGKVKGKRKGIKRKE